VNSSADSRDAGLPAVYEFGAFRLDLKRRLLFSKVDGTPQPVTARVFDTLAYFVQHAGTLLERAVLLDVIWPDADVESNNLSQNVSTLRRLLGEAPGEHRFISTVPGRGYRFIAEVSSVNPAPPAPRPQLAIEADQETRRLYEQALRLMERPTPENLALGIERLEAALARDRSFAQPWCWLAGARMFAVNIGFGSLDNLAAAEGEAKQALELDPTRSTAYAVLGNVHVHRGEWLDAEDCYRKAIALDGADPMPRVTHASFVLQSVGHGTRAKRQLLDALRLAPADPRMMLNLAMSHTIAGDDEAALGYADLAQRFGFPENTAPLPLVFAHAAQRAGRYAEAAEHVARMLPPPLRATGLAATAASVYGALAMPAQRSAAVTAIGQVLDEAPDAIMCTGNTAMLVIGWLALLERFDLAFELAHKAIDRCRQRRALPPNWQTLWLPELAPLRRLSDFDALVSRLGFVEYWARYGPADDRKSCAE
jgi:DNA-binding winged helix-turn-helix (wHTH) protein